MPQRRPLVIKSRIFSLLKILDRLFILLTVKVFIITPKAPEIWPQPSLWPHFLPLFLLHSVPATKTMPRLSCFLFPLSPWTWGWALPTRMRFLGVEHQESVWESHGKECHVKSKPHPRHSCPDGSGWVSSLSLLDRELSSTATLTPFFCSPLLSSFQLMHNVELTKCLLKT